ncbi:MAG: MerR family transcriptional regulator [Alphaproteobacteria bacterium]|nr:MerR family transcriptional regulator [Alphaproteobacteria bacterium]
MASGADKSPNAFRTISEVADFMGVPQHVLRFWESKFSQISPMKRGGGRRYYRPEDIEIIDVIRTLLHEDGYTIKGAQKYLKERGVKHVLSNLNNNAATEKSYELSGDDRDNPARLSGDSSQQQQGDADAVTLLKDLRGRLEKIRLNLKQD